MTKEQTINKSNRRWRSILPEDAREVNFPTVFTLHPLGPVPILACISCPLLVLANRQKGWGL